MLLLLKILLMLSLALIFVQDLKSRSVHWFLFPVSAGLVVVLYLLQQGGTGALVEMAGFNLLLVIFQLALIWGWLSLKHRRAVKLTAGWLGWGDILFLAVIAFCFSMANFMLFYVFSLLLILSGWLIRQKIRPGRSQQIPLAGLQSFLLLLVLLYSWLTPGISLTADDWLIKSLGR